jgi:hypothetical protein
MSGQSGFSGTPMRAGGPGGFDEGTGMTTPSFMGGFQSSPSPNFPGMQSNPRMPMMGNVPNITPPQGMHSFQPPDSVQRMPGGFGLSPQLLQMIAGLQSRSPKFTATAPPPAQSGWGANPMFRPAQNPYGQNNTPPAINSSGNMSR